MWNAGDVAVRAVRRSFRNDSGQEEKIDDFHNKKSFCMK